MDASGDGFVKRRHDAPEGFYEVEAAGLRWLGEATPAGGAAVVGVLEVRPGEIRLERLNPSRPTAAAAERFGRQLARTHAVGADAFGAPPAGWTGEGFLGRQRLSMRPESAWGPFYAEQRLLPYARRAREVGNLSRQGLAAVERLAQRLSDGDFDDGRPPARIHGDLWNGNLVCTPADVVLIDPAAHGGHGLTDLAMLHLFGAPNLDRITAAYAEIADLPDGWPDLLGLHALHPLLVHAVSHGPTYGREAERVTSQYA